MHAATPPPLPRTFRDTKARRLARIGVWLGAFVALSPVWFGIATIVRMIAVFDSVTAAGNGSARDLSSGIGRALDSAELGLAIAPAGVVLLIASILWLQKVRDRELAVSSAAIPNAN